MYKNREPFVAPGSFFVTKREMKPETVAAREGEVGFVFYTAIHAN